jgi:plasmid replication initiation protein
MNHKNLTVCKDNKVIEAGYKLSLNEQRVVLACIAQVNSKEALLKTDEFELSAKDFAAIFDVSEDRAYHALIDVTETLFNRYVVVDNPYPDRPKVKRLKMRWISSIEYLPDDGKISLCFSQKMLPFLSELKSTFTKYRLENIGKMTSVYGIRLYELLAQWQSVGTREIELDWLKNQFQLDDSYSRMDNLKRRVLDPAIRDINEHSNFQVSWTQRKTGRKVTHLTFTFYEKQPKVAKPTRATKPKEKTVYGVPVSEISKRALPGESHEQAAARINRENEAKNAPKPTPKPEAIATKSKPSAAKTKETDALIAALKTALKS